MLKTTRTYYRVEYRAEGSQAWQQCVHWPSRTRGPSVDSEGLRWRHNLRPFWIKRPPAEAMARFLSTWETKTGQTYEARVVLWEIDILKQDKVLKTYKKGVET